MSDGSVRSDEATKRRAEMVVSCMLYCCFKLDTTLLVVLVVSGILLSLHSSFPSFYPPRSSPPAFSPRLLRLTLIFARLSSSVKASIPRSISSSSALWRLDREIQEFSRVCKRVGSFLLVICKGGGGDTSVSFTFSSSSMGLRGAKTLGRDKRG